MSRYIEIPYKRRATGTDFVARWTYEEPRHRTLFLGTRPYRVFTPGLAFAEVWPVFSASQNHMRALHLFLADRPLTSPGSVIVPTRWLSWNGGPICLGQTAAGKIRKREMTGPEAFWMSSFDWDPNIAFARPQYFNSGRVSYIPRGYNWCRFSVFHHSIEWYTKHRLATRGTGLSF